MSWGTDEEDGEEEIPMELDLTLNGPPPASDDGSMKDQEVLETLSQKLLKYAKMILPHIGLVCLLTVYTVLGAGMFHVLESPNEKEVKEKHISKISGMRERFINELINRTVNVTEEPSIQELVLLTKNFSKEIIHQSFEAYGTQILSAKELDLNQSIKETWTFEASIFFATTVITTIGYGQMAPTTVYGRIFCIVFGLFGIPLLLVTIADIGKFLSDFLSLLFRTYRSFKRRVRKHSRRLSRRGRSTSASPDKAATPSVNADEPESEASSSDDELRIPVVMVMLVLVGYTALGGLLFQMWEGWEYFEAFYFCFITMATIGFGDLVPSQQIYMFFTMAYIVVGLALATMCIDLAGTEYIRKIHFVGQKIENAKEVMGAGLVSGLHAGEHLLKNTGYGFMRTAGGKLLNAGDIMNMKRRGIYPEDLELYPERNILYEPISPRVAKHLKANIHVRPEEITESEAYILHNRLFNREPPKRSYYFSPELIQRQYRPNTLKRYGSEPVLLIAPFLLKESDV